MTVEERLDRIEHITAGMAEQAQNDRQENRQLWRDTQRQITDLVATVGTLAAAVSGLALRIEETDDRLSRRIDQLAQESREADRKLGERIDGLVSAMGEWMRKQD